MRTGTISSGLFLVLLVASEGAFAAPTQTKLCFRWLPSFTDAGVGEDFYTANNSVRAYGVRVRVRRDTGQVIWNSYVNSTSGCVTLLMDTRFTYIARMYSSAAVSSSGGVPTQVVNYYSPSLNLYASNVGQNFRPPAGTQTLTFTYGASLSQTPSVMAAAGRFVKFRRGSVPPGTWQLINQGCPRGNGVNSGTCYSFVDESNTGTVYLDRNDLTGDTRRQKFAIAHELGHHINNIYGVVPLNDKSFDDRVCPSPPSGQSYTSLEWQSAAVAEGFADFVAAVAWNSTAEFDCRTTLGRECEIGFRYAETNCDPAPTGRGVTKDWTHALWDLATDGDVPYRELYTLISSLGGGDVTSTYWDARDQASAMGIAPFPYWTEVNGIDW